MFFTVRSTVLKAPATQFFAALIPSVNLFVQSVKVFAEASKAGLITLIKAFAISLAKWKEIEKSVRPAHVFMPPLTWTLMLALTCFEILVKRRSIFEPFLGKGELKPFVLSSIVCSIRISSHTAVKHGMTGHWLPPIDDAGSGTMTLASSSP